MLLLDEIAGGLTEHEVQSLIETIKRLRDEGISIIWIEHIVHALLAVVDRLMAIDFGKLIAEGDPKTVINSPAGAGRLHGEHGGMSLLELNDISTGYGSFQALFDISLTIEEGEKHAIIGANGAGKSTLLRTICGLLRTDNDKVRVRRQAHRADCRRTSAWAWASPTCPRAAGSFRASPCTRTCWSAPTPGARASGPWTRSTSSFPLLVAAAAAPGPQPLRGASSRLWPSAGA